MVAPLRVRIFVWGAAMVLETGVCRFTGGQLRHRFNIHDRGRYFCLGRNEQLAPALCIAYGGIQQVAELL